MSDALFVLAVVYCSAWMAISVAWNARILPARLASWCSMLFVIPEWAFFAPAPLISDYHISVRQWGATAADCQLTRLNIEQAGKWRIVFNPAKRPRKFLDDIISAVFEHLKDHQSPNYDDLQITVPYLLLLNFASSHIASDSVTQIQIIIEESRIVAGDRLTHVLFESVSHRL